MGVHYLLSPLSSAVPGERTAGPGLLVRLGTIYYKQRMRWRIQVAVAGKAHGEEHSTYPMALTLSKQCKVALP